VRLDPEAWMPAPAQAAIGIECRSDDARARDLLCAIDHAESHAEIAAERRLLEGLGGSCSSPIAALSRTSEGRIALSAAIFSPDGTVRIGDESEFAAGNDEAPLVLARRLLDRAPSAITEHFGQPL